jgi:hypothetical protein
MAQSSGDRGMPALADLTNLINLLALRAGSPIRPAVPDTLEQGLAARSESGDEFGLVDDEDFAHTTHQDQLRQSQALDKLRKRFLDRFAELFAAERNGHFVAAAVLREAECEDRVDIWLARNNGFSTPRDKEMIKAIEDEFNQLARDPDQGTANLLSHMIRYSNQRLSGYDAELKILLDPHKAELLASSSPMSGSLEFRNNVYSHLFSRNTPLKTDIQRLGHLVSLGADARRAVHADSDRSNAVGGPAWARKAITLLCLAGKVSSACHTFAEVTTKLWRGYTFKINSLRVPSPAHVPKERLNVLSALERAGVPDGHLVIQDIKNRPGTEAKFAKAQTQLPHVHAEIQLLFHLATNKIMGASTYVGASKLPCVLCATVLEIEGMLTCRMSHDHLYPRWMVPDIKTLPRDVRSRFWTVIAKLRETLRTTLLFVPEKGRNFRPESTVDMTLASGLTTATLETTSLEYRLARKQQQQAEEQGMLSRYFDPQKPETPEYTTEPDQTNESSDSTVLQQAQSETAHYQGECGGCPQLTYRQCSRCGLDRFCSRACEGRMSPAHKFKCSNGALTTADYLMSDCIGDEIPKDPDVLTDFGFQRLLTFPDRSKLLGLYKGLMYLDVEAEELHEWRISGRLADRIVETFERIPPRSRGEYFPWFVANRHLIFPPVPQTHAVTDNDISEHYYKPAKFLLEPRDRLKPVKSLEPSTKRNCFMFAALIIQSQHPSPELPGPYYDFGFCACRNGEDESILGVLYQRLLIGDMHQLQRLYWGDMPTSGACAARFSDFCQAFENQDLIQFMDNSGMKQQRSSIRHLETYLNAPEETRHLPVWMLLTFLKSGDAECPPTEIFVPFGFVRCADPRVRSRLKQLYASILALADAVALQEAQATGRLLQFAEQYVEISPDLAEILKWTVEPLGMTFTC